LLRFSQCFCWVFVFLTWGLIEWLIQVAVVESNANSNIVGQLNSGFNESNILNGNGTISRTNSGCGYVSSTSSAMTDEPCVSCTTFNILAPIYKRLDQKVCSCPFWIQKLVLILLVFHLLLIFKNLFVCFYFVVK
jgi:hypothetical protein